MGETFETLEFSAVGQEGIKVIGYCYSVSVWLFVAFASFSAFLCQLVDDTVHVCGRHLSGCSEGWRSLMARAPGSGGGDVAACRAGTSPARAWPTFGLLIFLSLPSQHLCLSPVLQPVRGDGPHSQRDRLQAPSPRRLVLAAQGVRGGGI